MMRVRFIAAALLLAIVAVSAQEEVDEKDVLVLDPSNFDDAIKNNPKILVEFYAPWCGHCKQLTPEYAKAATKLKSDGVTAALAKVDADAHKELGTKFGVQGFPTLKWFVDGEPTDYAGPRQADGIVSWISKRMGPPAKLIATSAEFDTFSESADVVVIGFFSKAEGADFTTFEKAAMAVDSVSFGYATDKKVLDRASQKAGDIVLYKKFDAGKAVYDGKEIEVEALKTFVQINELAYVTEFTPETSGKIFGSPITQQVLLFSDKESDGHKATFETFETAMKGAYGKVVGVYVPADASNVMGFFGIEKKDLPTVHAVQVPKKEEGGGGGLKKFKGPDDLTADKLQTFLDEFTAGKLKSHVKSEPVPAEPVDEHGVTTVVGSTFDDVVMDPAKDVFMEFYAPWCGHCKQIAPIWDKLGAEFKSVDTMVIGKMDATANDPPESLNIQGFPTLKFFKAGSDKSKPIDFDGDRTLEGFKKFLTDQSGK